MAGPLQVNMSLIKEVGSGVLITAIILTTAIATAGCTSADSGVVTINPQNSCWSPAMSSVIGIGLSANYSGKENVTYEWSADYGNFLLWTPKVIRCEPPCTTTETVWWTYISEDEIPAVGDLPEEIHIKVNATNAGTRDILAESTVILKKSGDGTYCISERN
jgi:hypothetical protein